MKDFRSARIGVDLGGTKIEAIVMDTDGSIVQKLRRNTPSGNYPETLNTISSMVNELTKSCALPNKLPIGIGTPGAISLKTGLMMNCNSICLNHQPLVADLEAMTQRQIRIANDADCFALSEASDGAAKDSNLVFGVILGTGVGGGLISNKKLVQGSNAICGEWGHNSLAIQALQHPIPETLLNDPHQCFCGRHHCVETWLAGPSLSRHFELLTNETLSAQHIIERAREGQETALMLFKLHIELIALGLSSIINMLDPDSIVFGGGLSNVNELYQQLPEVLPKYVFSDSLNTELAAATFGDSSGVRGAAWLWQHSEVEQILKGKRV